MSPTPLRQKQRRKQQRQIATKGEEPGNTGGNGNIASLQYQAQWYRLRLAWLRKINCTRGKKVQILM